MAELRRRRRRQVGEPARQSRERDPQLHPRQLRTDAPVEAVAEGELGGGRLAVGVERVVETHPGVASCGGEVAHDDVAAADLPAADLHVLLGEARERHLHDAEVAQQLLDDPVDGLRLGGEPVVDLRSLEEHGGAERQHAGTGLEATGEGAVGEAGEVEVVDGVALLADDLADEPIARVEPLAPGEVHEVLTGP
ncbi:MAG: hypothetical protein AVDCRST_MAG47-797 [uncultured Nocardioidaceae bacterium]|uniref:Uncharacterized protein n=1 Tax=uncultured Nocardioidaceae bacterium TaxID=253824 RepID=A0A6J4MSZ0_9ACTN|nr:MAG: hypothetical protein AVDCRST_MAG47-797 [uncultured Nocardioidaceae bacterium]